MRDLTGNERLLVCGGRTSYTTAGGNTFSVATTLSSAQAAVLGKIVDYGYAHNRVAGDIQTAVNQAFYESSLGSLESNPTNSGVEGLYQYDASTWSALGHSSLNRASDTDQIAAMYGDITSYATRWVDGRTAGTIPENLSFDSYLEIKHHLGNNSTDWTNSILADYKAKVATLSVGSSKGATGTSTGGAGGIGEGSGGTTGSGTTIIGGSTYAGNGTVSVGTPTTEPR